MNIKGKLIEKHDIQNISETFRKREFIVEYAENLQYPEFLKFELIQSNCDQIEDIPIGSEISVTFNLKGRKWTDKEGKVIYFNSLQAWRIELVVATTKNEGHPPTDIPPLSTENWMLHDASKDIDLPF